MVEGIGYDFVPEALSREPGLIDEWVKTSDEDAFPRVAQIMRHEGLLVGGSSGSALAGALAWLKNSEKGKEIAQQKGKNVVVVLPDGYVLLIMSCTVCCANKSLHTYSIRNYMSKPWFLDFAMSSKTTPLKETIARALQDDVSDSSLRMHL